MVKPAGSKDLNFTGKKLELWWSQQGQPDQAKRKARS
jgi:hypothetical protein